MLWSTEKSLEPAEITRATAISAAAATTTTNKIIIIIIIIRRRGQGVSVLNRILKRVAQNEESFRCESKT
jgi:hypothetical protein